MPVYCILYKKECGKIIIQLLLTLHSIIELNNFSMKKRYIILIIAFTVSKAAFMKLFSKHLGGYNCEHA